MGEPQEENDLFFVCSFIEYIARVTHNRKEYIVKKIGKENIDNYESSMYYETPEYIYECYKNNKIL